MLVGGSYGALWLDGCGCKTAEHAGQCSTASSRPQRQGWYRFAMAAGTMERFRWNCPACGVPARSTRLVVERRYRLFRCPDCRTQFLRALVTEPEASAYWAHKEYKLDVYGSPDVQHDYDKRYQFVLDRVVSQAGNVSSVVDFGCGSGNFLSFAKRQGLDATGVDVDPTAVAAARSQSLRAFFPDEVDAHVQDRSVDMVTLWDVIEHIYDPDDFLSDVLRKVRPNGVLVIETPDATFPIRPLARFLYYISAGRIRLVRRIYYWEHKVYFSVEGLRRLLANHGCEVLAVMKLTSPQAKMARLFQMSANSGRLEARFISRCWPFLESLTRRLGAGNKIVLIGRTSPAPVSAR